MSRYKFSGTFRDGSGNVVNGGTVSVYASGTTTASSIYETETGTTIVNSTTTGTDGTFTFYILEGDYYEDHTRKIILSKSGYTSKTYDYSAPNEFVNGPFTQAAIESALTAIGTTNKVTFLLRPGTWVISSNADWSAYTNVTFKSVPGAVISHGAFTLNIPNLDAGLYQVFSGTGAVTLSGKVKEVYPQWWTDNTTPGTTNMTTAIQAAANTGKRVLLTENMRTGTAITLSVAGTTVTAVHKGITLDAWGVNGFSITTTNVRIYGFTFNELSAAGGAAGYDYTGITATDVGYADVSDMIAGGWNIFVKYYNVDDGWVTKCEISVVNEFVRLSEGVTRVHITDNLTNTSGDGVVGTRTSVNLENVATVRPEGILISDNTFYGGDYGVYSATGVNGGVIITDNDISAGISAIKLPTPNYTTIANNTSLLAQGSSYVLDFPDESTLVDHKNTITGNKIWNNSTGGGIYIGTKSQHWIVANNIIDTAAYAIEVGTLSQDIIIDSNIGDINAVMQRIHLNDNLKNVSVTNNVNIRVSRSDPTTENGAVMVFNNTFDQKVTTRTIVPTTGTWNLGDRIYKNNTLPATTLLSSLGDILGWVCTSAGTFSAATDSTGDTTNTSTTITGLTDTSDFYIGDYVTISAGFPSATIPYMITGKTATTLTFMFAATSTQANVTIATPDPVFSSFGQQGYRSGAATPVGAVTPNFIGEEYLDSTAVIWYKSTGLVNTNWVALN